MKSTYNRAEIKKQLQAMRPCSQVTIGHWTIWRNGNPYYCFMQMGGPGAPKTLGQMVELICLSSQTV